MDNSSKLNQLNQFYHAFLNLYIKPHLNLQIPELDKLLSQSTASQSYKYLNQILNQNKMTNLVDKFEQPNCTVLKKAFTYKQQQETPNINRPISAQKVNFQRRISQRNTDSNSVDNNAHHIPHRKTPQQHDNKQGKYIPIIKKLKDLFETNNKKIKQYNQLSIVKQENKGTNLIGHKIYTLDNNIKKY